MEPREEGLAEHSDRELEATVGRNVRRLRKSAGFTAAELAARAELSAAMISRIESATISSSLTTIQRLASALDVPASALLRGAEVRRSAIIVRAGEGAPAVRAGTAVGHRYWGLGNLLSTTGSSLEPVLVELNAEAPEFPLYEHSGVEFLFMVSGAIEFVHGERREVLRAGDSVLLDAEAPHGPVRVTEAPARFLSVNPVGL